MSACIPKKRSFFLFLFICSIWLISSGLKNNSAITSASPISFEYSILQGSKVFVLGSTNINEFTCFSEENYSKRSADFYFDPSKTSITFRDAVLKISTHSLNCGNVAMNSNLCRALDADHFPFIIVDLQEAHSKDGKPLNLEHATEMIAKVQITLAGHARTNTIHFSGVQTPSGGYHFTGDQKLSLSDYHIEPPTALFGLVKVHDIITVRFDLYTSIRTALAE